MKHILLALLLCLSLSPVFAEDAAEESSAHKAARYYKAAAPLIEELVIAAA